MAVIGGLYGTGKYLMHRVLHILLKLCGRENGIQHTISICIKPDCESRNSGYSTRARTVIQLRNFFKTISTF